MLSAVTLEIVITNLTGGLTYEFKVQITYYSHHNGFEFTMHAIHNLCRCVQGQVLVMETFQLRR